MSDPARAAVGAAVVLGVIGAQLALLFGARRVIRALFALLAALVFLGCASAPAAPEVTCWREDCRTCCWGSARGAYACTAPACDRPAGTIVRSNDL